MEFPLSARLQEGEIANIQAGIQQMDSMAPGSAAAGGGGNSMSFQPQQGRGSDILDCFSSCFRRRVQKGSICQGQNQLKEHMSEKITSSRQMPSQMGVNMMQQQQQLPQTQQQQQQRTYPQAIMSTAPRNQGDFGAAPFLPPPPAKTGRPGGGQHQQQQGRSSMMSRYSDCKQMDSHTFTNVKHLQKCKKRLREGVLFPFSNQTPN